MEKTNRLQILVAAMNKDGHTLPDTMQIDGKLSDTIIVNQCDRYEYSEYQRDSGRVQVFCCNEKGVGLSRNLGLMRSSAEIIQFGDEDIVYDKGYAQKILDTFDQMPEADMILFNVQAAKGRETYHNTDCHKVSWRNYGRYPAYAICARRDALIASGVTFSLLFGGGAKHMNGEDSLFLHDCLQKGLRIYTSETRLGMEEARPSTWFKGFNEKFFYDRGVLYRYLYGRMALPFGIRFIFNHRKEMCTQHSFGECVKLLYSGIRGRDIKL